MRIVAAIFLALMTAGCNCGHRVNEPQRRICSQNTLRSDELPTQVERILDCHDAYHVIVFSYNNYGRVVKPASTHTFATWVKTRDKQVIDQVDISWCPKEGTINAAMSEVPGRNKCLAATLENAKGMNLSYWVMRTDKNFFDTALKHREDLTMYKALDAKTRPRAVNCIHACSDVAGHLETGTACGANAGRMVANFYVKTNKAWQADDKWIIPAVMRTNNCKLP